jgi:predicted MFS family arabinose efflux permease
MTGQEIAGRFVGAPLVPVLLAVGVAMPFAVDAATYLLAAVLVAGLRTAPPEHGPRTAGRTLRHDVAEGIRVLWRNRVLRSLCISTTLCNIGVGALIATLVVLIKGWLDAGDSGFAAALTVYGAGGVAGGLVASWITDRMGRARTLIVGGIVQTGCLVVLGTVRSLPAAVVALGVFGCVGMVWNVTEVTTLQRSTPAALLGRVGSAFRTLSIAGAPAGALLGGAVAAACGANTPMLAAATLFALGVAALTPALIN